MASSRPETSVPAIDEFAEALQEEPNWLSLGVFLKLPKTELGLIESSGFEIVRCYLELYSLMQRLNMMRTWAEIAAALRRLKNLRLADEIDKKYIQSPSIKSGESHSQAAPSLVGQGGTVNVPVPSVVAATFTTVSNKFFAMLIHLRNALETRKISIQLVQFYIQEECDLAPLKGRGASIENIFTRLQSHYSILEADVLKGLFNHFLSDDNKLSQLVSDYEVELELFKKSTSLNELMNHVKLTSEQASAEQKIVKLKMREFWGEVKLGKFLNFVKNFLLTTLEYQCSHMTIGKGCICVKWNIPKMDSSDKITLLPLEFVTLVGIISLHFGEREIYNVPDEEGYDTLEAAMLKAIELNNRLAISVLRDIGGQVPYKRPLEEDVTDSGVASTKKHRMSDQKEFIDNLEIAIIVWKNCRNRTIEKLESLANDCDENYVRNQKWGFWRTVGVGIGGTLMGISAGLAVPLVMGVGLFGIAGGVLWSDKEMEANQKNGEKKCQEISATEIDAYTNMMELFQEFGERVRDVYMWSDLLEHCERQPELFACFIKEFNIPESVKQSPAFAALVLGDRSQEYLAVMDTVGDITKAAKLVASQAEKIKQLLPHDAKTAGLSEEAKSIRDAADRALLLKDVYNSNIARETLLKAALTAKDVIGLLTEVVDRHSRPISGWYTSSSVGPIFISDTIRQSLKQALQQAKDVANSLDESITFISILSTGHNTILASVAFALSPVSFIVNTVTGIHVGNAPGDERKSPAGCHIRSKVERLKKDIVDVDIVYNCIKEKIQ